MTNGLIRTAYARHAFTPGPRPGICIVCGYIESSHLVLEWFELGPIEAGCGRTLAGGEIEMAKAMWVIGKSIDQIVRHVCWMHDVKGTSSGTNGNGKEDA